MARVFLSCVSTEFRGYRELLTQQLSAAGVDVVVQEHFADSNQPILERLDQKVKGSDFVVHLVGLGTGYRPKDGLPGCASEVEQFLAGRDRAEFLRTSGLEPHAAELPRLSYTQWEYWLARYHRKTCLIYHIDPAAEREEKFVKRADEEAEQTAHLTRIRSTFDGRASVGGPWQLATRVMVSLTERGTLALPGEGGVPAIVLGFTHTTGTADVTYSSSGALRWKGHTFLLDEPRPVPFDKGVRGVCDRLTQLLHLANSALADERVLAKCVVELVLPEEMLTVPLREWLYTHENYGPVPICGHHPVRVRLAGRAAKHTSVRNIRARLELLRKHEEKLDRVCRQVPAEFRTSAAARPLAVVHESGEGCWHPLAVVCGGFAAPPPRLKFVPAKAAGTAAKKTTPAVKKVKESEVFRAVFEGIPFLIWPFVSSPESAVGLAELEQELTLTPRPADLCEHLERRPFVVFAECKDPPFPEGGKLSMQVTTHGAP